MRVGFVVNRQSGSHIILRRGNPYARVVVPDHKRVRLGTLRQILNEAGVTVRAAIDRGMFERVYAHAFDGDKNWQGLAIPTGSIYQWDDTSTYIKRPPYFDNMVDPNTPIQDFHLMRVLAPGGPISCRVGNRCRPSGAAAG